jgi:hypothetical protein
MSVELSRRARIEQMLETLRTIGVVAEIDEHNLPAAEKALEGLVAVFGLQQQIDRIEAARLQQRMAEFMREPDVLERWYEVPGVDPRFLRRKRRHHEGAARRLRPTAPRAARPCRPPALRRVLPPQPRPAARPQPRRRVGTRGARRARAPSRLADDDPEADDLARRRREVAA